jgi:hypothetical protein
MDALGIAKDDYYSGADMFYTEQSNKNNVAGQQFTDAMSIWNAETSQAWEKAKWDEAARQYAIDDAFRNKQLNAQYGSGSGTGNNNNNNNKQPEKQPEKEPDEIEEDYSDWEALDWEGYFATIRNNESKSAAEEELNRMTKAGLIPKNMISYAAIGARGRLGH